MDQNNNSSSNNKQTPARRGRGGGRSNRGRKNYASEGDVLAEMPTPANFPATPMKSNNCSPRPGLQQTGSKSTAKKSNKKSRPNHVSTSPAPAQSSQRTPPPSASVAVSSAAFASSSSFHSPAPGTLPRPSFIKFARSQSCATPVEETYLKARSGPAATQLLKEPSPPASDAESPTPPRPTSLATNEHHASPLDFLFNAHRAEKEKLCRANSANATAGLDGPFSAPPESRHPSNPEYHDEPIPLKLPARPVQRGPSDNTGALGNAPRPEVFALPIHERIRAARPPDYHARQSSSQLATPPHLDKSEEVKRLLGIGTPSPKPSSVAMQGHTNTAAASSPSGASPGYPQRRGGDLSSGGTDHRKTLAEDALRKALGLNFPLPMAGGLDGNNSPQSHANRFPGHA